SMVWATFHWDSPDLLKYFAFLLVAIFSVGTRITAPGATGTLPVTFLFVLLGVLDLTPSETVVLASVVAAVQCLWESSGRARIEQELFKVATMGTAGAAATTSSQY